MCTRKMYMCTRTCFCLREQDTLALQRQSAEAAEGQLERALAAERQALSLQQQLAAERAESEERPGESCVCVCVCVCVRVRVCVCVCVCVCACL